MSPHSAALLTLLALPLTVWSAPGSKFSKAVPPGCESSSDGPRSVTAPAVETIRASAVNDPATVERVWTRLTSGGTPVIEPFPPDSACMIVTFLFRDPTADRVSIAGALTGWLDSLATLERVRGTDIWYRSVLLRRTARVGYQFRVVAPGDTGTGPLAGRPVTDPLSARSDSALGTRSELVGPDAPGRRWLDPRIGIPHGRVEPIELHLAGRDTAQTAWVYTPPGHDTTASYPLLVLFDGGAYAAGAFVPTPRILDNLLADDRIEPVVALFLPQETTPPARQAIMGNNPVYARWVAEEVIPYVQRRFAATRDPDRVVIGGSSLGGLEASFVALHHPDVVRNVLSQSGSYQWVLGDDPAAEGLTRWVAASATLPIRFYLEAGIFEVPPTRIRRASLLEANRRFRDVLTAKGYPVTYREIAGGHEYLSWKGTLAEALPIFFGK